MKYDHELHLTTEEASDRRLTLLQLTADPWEALRGYCHEGVRVCGSASPVKPSERWTVSICSLDGYGATIHEALNNLRDQVRVRLEDGQLGC